MGLLLEWVVLAVMGCILLVFTLRGLPQLRAEVVD
jgi:hypothetical protein